MDALEFFAQACRHSAPGDVVDARMAAAAPDWRHAEALAQRMGLSPLPDQPGMYRKHRDAHAWTLRWLRHDDFELWHALFVRCFGHSMPLAQWRWKYRDAERVGVGVFTEGRMVAFYGGMPRPLRVLGQAMAGVQVGDVMVDPAFRGSLSRRGPFQMAASTFLEQQLSPGAPCQLGFGFPNTRAMAVAHRLGLYREVDEVVELSWQAPAAALPWWLGAELCSAARALAQADRLWAQMQAGFKDSVLGVRDAAYLRTRYAEHPSHTHEWLGLRHRLSRQVLALAVARRHADGRLEILDLLGPRDRLQAMVQAVLVHAQRTAAPLVSLWLTRSHLHVLQDSQPQVHTLEVKVPTNAWTPDPHGPVVDQRWWLTGGDIDFR